MAIVLVLEIKPGGLQVNYAVDVTDIATDCLVTAALVIGPALGWIMVWGI